jgi:hypothetical protein
MTSQTEKPTGVVAKRTAEEVLREKRDREAEEERLEDEQRKRESQARQLEEAERHADLLQQIDSAIPEALERLAAKGWEGGELKSVTTWNGSFKKVQVKRFAFTDHFSYWVDEVDATTEELATWSLATEPHNNEALFLLSNGHFAQVGWLLIHTGVFKVDINAWYTQPVDGYIGGLIDNVALVRKNVEAHTAYGLLDILTAINAL